MDFAISEYNGARLEMPDAIDEYFGEGPKPTLLRPKISANPGRRGGKSTWIDRECQGEHDGPEMLEGRRRERKVVILL